MFGQLCRSCQAILKVFYSNAQHSHKCKILLHLALAAYRVNMNNENNYVDIMIYFAKSTYQLCKIVNLTQLDLFQFSE